MHTPQPVRPHFPPGYIDNAKSFVSWAYVEQRLREAENYWICTVRPDGRPHAIPKWGVWVEGKLYFDGSPQTRSARNLAANPAVTVHLESGTEVVIVDGVVREVIGPPRELAEQLAAGYKRKYTTFDYAPAAETWDQGGLFVVTLHTVIAWTHFTENPTKFVLEGQ